MSNDTTPYFFPDPYNTGEAVSVEATSLDEAQKIVQSRAPKSDSKPTAANAKDATPADMTPTQNSAPAPEADESQERTTS